MRKTCFAVFALLLSLAGCVPVDSLNPLYTDKDIAFDDSLLGIWVGPDNGEDGGLEFTSQGHGGKPGYTLTMTDKNKDSSLYKKTVYFAHLVKLNGRLFLDVVPEVWDAHSASYSLQVKSARTGSTIEPRLLRLGETAYMEFGGASDSAGKIEAHLRRAHWILKVAMADKKLQLDWMDDDDFKKAVQKGSVTLPNAILGQGKDKDVVITASTAELQKFVVDHADDAAVFTTHTPLHRKEKQ